MDTLVASLELHWKALADSLIGLCLLLGTWAAYRTKRWLLELVEREREHGEQLLSEAQKRHERELARQQTRETERANALLTRLTGALRIEEQPSLNDWLTNVEREWSMRPTSEDSRPPPSESGLRERQRPSDWREDEDRTRQLPDETTRPETPDARARRSSWPPKR